MNLGGLPAVLGIFIVVVVLVRLFERADRMADRLVAQLHHLRRRGGRTPRLLLSRRGASALHPRSYVGACASRGTTVLTRKEN